MSKTKKRPESSDALAIIDRRYFEGKPEMMAMLEEELVNAELSRLVYDLRAGAKLTQAQLAKRVGTTQSVISRLEDADYEGHSLAMLRRIARAVGYVVEIRVCPSDPAPPPQGKPRKSSRPNKTATMV